MISACTEKGLRPPLFEEIGASFRVTLFSEPVADRIAPDWYDLLMAHLGGSKEITTKEASRLWQISDRTARTRLRSLVNKGILAEIGTGPKDPKKTYVLKTSASVSTQRGL